jgi:hypothetical protein
LLLTCSFAATLYFARLRVAVNLALPTLNFCLPVETKRFCWLNGTTSQNPGVRDLLGRWSSFSPDAGGLLDLRRRTLRLHHETDVAMRAHAVTHRGEKAVNGGNRLRPFADGGGHSLHRIGPDVADSEDTG